MRHKLVALSLGLLGMTLLVSPAQGQRYGSGRSGGFGSRVHVMVGRVASVHRGRHGYPGYGYGPNFYPYYDSYSDARQESVAEPPAPPYPYIAQSDASVAPAATTKPAESLVMELRGDRWVRLTSYGAMEVAGQAGSPAVAMRTEAPATLPPAVLVFRDGHQEEAAKYTIVGTTIYLKADYWSSGSWTRKVQVSELNVAATLKVNQERGAKFSLPSRPGEVMMRP